MSNLFRPVLCMKKGSLPLPRRLFFQSGLFVCLRGWLSAGLHTQKKIVNEFSTKACKKDGARGQGGDRRKSVYASHLRTQSISSPCSCCCFCCCFPVFGQGFMLRNIKKHNQTWVSYNLSHVHNTVEVYREGKEEETQSLGFQQWFTQTTRGHSNKPKSEK